MAQQHTMKQHAPLERDVRAILDAAGVHDLPREAITRAQAALAAYARALYPRVTSARNRWRARANDLRERYAAHLDWSEIGPYDDPTT